MSGGRTPRLAVIGAGVSGLTAAFRLRQGLGDDAVIDVYDAASEPGGLLHTRTVGGVAVDAGAEAFIVRRPEARDLVAELGLAERVVSPGGLRPAIFARGALHTLPSPAVMGIPADPSVTAGLADPDDLARMTAEPDTALAWTAGADPSVGDLVADRFGPSVVARSVDPMLGGVYSALAGQLGLRETIPALARALDDGAPSLTAAVRTVLDAGSAASGPVFGALRGGYRELVDALVAAGRAHLHLGVEVIGVEALGGESAGGGPGFAVRSATGGGRDDAVEYDGVVVAVPIWTAGRLLAALAPEPAAVFADVAPAGSAIVAVAVPEAAALPAHSGVLVATDEDAVRLKAITLSSQKWPHLRGGPVATLRTSFGRLGDRVDATDDELVRLALADLETVFGAAGLAAPDIVDAVVQRWPTGLPHYAPGHLARVGAAAGDLPRGIAVAGAGYAGVGVPACIGTATAAVGKVTADLRT